MRLYKITHIKLCFVFLQVFCIIENIPSSCSEYISLDEPPCRQDCSELQPNLQEECLNDLMEFYSYKMIKGIFNYGKTAIYAGLWVSRYEKPDDDLFENVFNSILNQYNDEKLLGGIEFSQLNSTTRSIYEQLRKYTVKKSSKLMVPYGSYPSLTCPHLCDQELVTWQMMFYLTLAVFILSSITISLYSIFLRKQYSSLKKRLNLMNYNSSN